MLPKYVTNITKIEDAEGLVSQQFPPAIIIEEIIMNPHEDPNYDLKIFFLTAHSGTTDTDGDSPSYIRIITNTLSSMNRYSSVEELLDAECDIIFVKDQVHFGKEYTKIASESKRGFPVIYLVGKKVYMAYSGTSATDKPIIKTLDVDFNEVYVAHPEIKIRCKRLKF